MKLIFVMIKKLLLKFLNIFFQMYQIFHRELLRRCSKIPINYLRFRSFVIPLSDGKEDRRVTSTETLEPEITVPSTKRRKRRNDE